MITVVLGTLFFLTMPTLAVGAFVGWYVGGVVGCVVGMLLGYLALGILMLQ
jgi:hypothetical protein